MATDRCIITRGCALKAVLHEARRDFLKVLDRYTIADAAGQRGPASLPVENSAAPPPEA
jgi:DNA-binding IscR family transcriptional regulator